MRIGGVRKAAVAVLLAASTLALWGGGNAVAADQGASQSDLRASLKTAVENYLASRGAIEHISAVSLRITFAGERPSIKVPVGTTLYGGGEPISADNLWQVGSNTKAFTSVMLLQLEAEHKLSIHDTVGKWLPRYRAWRHIRIEHLLDMTSGIPDYLSDPRFFRDYAAAPSSEFSSRRLVSYVAHAPLQRRGYHYSNTNYVLAQMILRKATDDAYAHQLRKRIAEPLGLRDLSYRPAPYPRAVTDRMPGGYFFDSSIPQLAPLQGRDLRRLNLSYAQGAGGIVSTLKDLAKWERALYEGRELPAKQQRELESLVSQKSGKPIKKTTHADPKGYGLGVGEATSSLGHFWFYEGETFGFRVLHIYIPRSGTLIDVAVNSSTENDDLSDLGLAAWVILRKAGTA